MRAILLSVSVLFLFSCANRRNVYKAEENYIRSFAILPLKITQTGHRAKNVSDEDIKKNNEEWGYIFQESLHSYVTTQTARNRKGPIVTIQSVQKTNAILKERGYHIDSLYDSKPEDLARLLGVDAVLMTTIAQDKNFSDGVAYGVSAGRKILSAVNSPVNVPWVNSSDLNMNSFLYDSKDSRLLWKTYRSGGSELPTDVDGRIRYFSSWIAKRIPYRS